MDASSRELNNLLKARLPSASGLAADDAIAGAATINHIVAPAAGLSLRLLRVWLGCDNAHATDPTSVTFQDTAGVILAVVFIHAGSAANGFVDFEGQNLDEAEGLDIVIAGGTAVGHVVSYTNTNPV